MTITTALFCAAPFVYFALAMIRAGLPVKNRLKIELDDRDLIYFLNIRGFIASIYHLFIIACLCKN